MNPNRSHGALVRVGMKARQILRRTSVRLMWMFAGKRKTYKLSDKIYQGLAVNGPIPLLREADLLPGDILFCVPSRGPSGKGARYVRRQIQKQTLGPYVHCGIYLRSQGSNSGTVVEAVGKGVDEVFFSAFSAQYSYMAVAREPALQPKGLTLLEEFARSHAGARTQYSLLGAALVPIRELRHAKRYYGPNLMRRYKRVARPQNVKQQFFCSQFVLQCFQTAGIPGLDSPYYRAEVWSPNAIAYETIFIEVGYVAPSYSVIREDDVFLRGCGYCLAEWERARKA